MDDLISRQAAIDAHCELCDMNDKCICIYCKDIDMFESLPTVEPEIIKCKDCLMHGVCRFEQGLGLDGYCSQAERRSDD